MKIKKLVPMLIAVITLFTLTAGAATTGDYTINGSETIPIPGAYVYQYSINYLSDTPDEDSSAYFNQPSDLFLDTDENLFVADTKNNRIVKLKKDGVFLAAYTHGGEKSLLQPQGVYADENGDVFIADTGNSRVVHLKGDGTLVTEYGKPDSPMLVDTEVYNPTKLSVSPTGGLYILMGENMMSIDRENRFRGFIGQNDIGFDLLEWMLRLVASDEQKKVIDKRSAAIYSNFCLTDDGLIYAVSSDIKQGQIKVLNSVGNNIYRKLSTVSSDNQIVNDLFGNFFNANLLNKSFRYGETVNGKDPAFADICVDKNGIITAIEKQSGKLYQYDRTGNLLCVFGTLGSGQGEFSIPASITVDDNGYLYVLDSSYGNIQVFAPTKFISTVQSAGIAYSDGDYETADRLWRDVLDLDETYPLAHYGVANTEFKNGQWQNAMDGYRYSNDRKEYSKAYAEYRYSFTKAHFFPATIAVIAFCILIGVLIVVGSKTSKKALVSFEGGKEMKLSTSLLMGVGMLYRPGRTIDSVKEGRGRTKAVGAFIILAAVFAVRIFFIHAVSYQFQDIEPSDWNLALEFIKLIVPVLTWIGAVYLISAQFDGESTLLENFICAAYAMVPYIVINFFAAFLSHILSWDEKGLFALLVNGVGLWYMWLLARSVKRLNDYSVARTVLISIVTVVAVVLIWFVTLFGYSVVVRLLKFAGEVWQEVQLILS